MTSSTTAAATMPGHERILASAGSGKTYELSARYVRLLAAGAPVGSMLASTFTRAAASEIRDRVLMRLAGAAENDDERTKLATAIGCDRLDPASVIALLRAVTERLHAMQIRTLDAFFASVTRAYALELGLPLDARIVEEVETQTLRADAVAALLARRRDLVDLLRLMTQGTSERSVLNVIDRAVAELHELYREADPAAWDVIRRRRSLGDATLDGVLRTIESLDLDGALDRARRDDLDRARSGAWENVLKGGIAAAVAERRGTFGKKPLGPAVERAYEPLVEHAVAVLANRIRDQTLAARDLLRHFDEAYGQLKRQRRMLTFADLTSAMIDVHALGRNDEIGHRIDVHLAHLLLDEFQDTSVLQWRALAPLAGAIVHAGDRGRTFFCVGDVKQSIYGWRGACPEVLESIGTLLAGPDGQDVIAMRWLSKSWRSAPPIIEVVNRVFGSIAGNAALADDGAAAREFADGFAEHSTALGDLSGIVELRSVAESGDDEKSETVRQRAAAALVRDLHVAHPKRTIAVLTRTNDAVARLLYELGPGRLDLPATGRGGGPLTDSPAVEAVLDLVRLADHPDDSIAAFNVVSGPLAQVVDLTSATEHGRRRLVARAVRRRLLDDGYAATIADWVRVIAPACDERQHRRLLQLVDLAGAYDARATLRPDEFVRAAEQTAVAETAPSPIQVMTIHQAKGLEFDFVVLPELETHLRGERRPAVVFARDGAVGPIVGISRWMSQDLRGHVPEVEPMFAAHHVHAVRESLSLLYVAMTRAKRGLYMLIEPKKAKGDGMPATVAGVLRSALTDGGAIAAEQVLFRCGGDVEPKRESEGEGAPEASRPARRPSGPLDLTTGGAAPGRGISAAPASAHSAESGGLARRLQLHDDDARLRGLVVHRLFEQIEWLETFDPDEPTLIDFARRAAPRRDHAWAQSIVRSFLAATDRPEVRRAMSRGTIAPERVRIWRERRFARLVPSGGESRVQEGSIDRVVAYLGSDGGCARAEVIDFKTDQIGPEDADARAETYRGQLETYREVAASSLRVDPDAVAMTVLFVNAGRAVTLGEKARVDLPLWGGE